MLEINFATEFCACLQGEISLSLSPPASSRLFREKRSSVGVRIAVLVCSIASPGDKHVPDEMKVSVTSFSVPSGHGDPVQLKDRPKFLQMVMRMRDIRS